MLCHLCHVLLCQLTDLVGVIDPGDWQGTPGGGGGGGGGGHSHQLPYGGVPLYWVDFEGVIWVRTASGARNYEIFPKIGYVFGVRTASGARDCEISLK